MLCVQQSGVYLVVPEQPQTIDDATCAYVIMRPSEIPQSPWNLTTEQAAQIGMAICLVWAVAFTFRTVAKFTFQTHGDSTNE